MPNRILREGILTSRLVSELSEPAQLLYYKLMSAVDDYGRYDADLDLIRARCFPLEFSRWSTVRIGESLLELGESPLVTVYCFGSKKYLQINNFGQRLQAKPKYPEPDSPESTVIHRDSPESTASRARAHSESESYSESYSESESETKSDALPPLPANWQIDEAYLPFVVAYRKTGKPLVDGDFADAHWKYKKLDFEQKLTATKGILQRVEAGVWDDPMFIPVPTKYLDREWERPVVSRVRPLGKKSNRELAMEL